MADRSQVEQLKLEDFSVDKMARRITDFWGKGILRDPFADQARSKGAVPGSAVPGDGTDGNTSGKTFLPYLPRTGTNGKGGSCQWVNAPPRLGGCCGWSLDSERCEGCFCGAACCRR